MKKLLDDSKGQVSAELIIVLAGVLAIALLAVTSLNDAAAASDKIADKNAKAVLAELKK